MGPGSLAGAIIGVVVCVIFALIAIKVTKKEKVKTDALLAELSDNLKNEVKNQTFTKAEGNNMFTSQALVAGTTEENDTVKAVLLFWMSEHQEHYTRTVKLNKSEAESKGIAKGNFVPVLMKYDKEMHYYDFKKII